MDRLQLQHPTRENGLTIIEQGDTNMNLSKTLLVLMVVYCWIGNANAQESSDSEQALRDARHALFARTALNLEMNTENGLQSCN